MTTNANKTIVLITGANRGIGYEIVKALLQTGSRGPYHVYLGARDIEKGEKAVASLTAEYGNSVSAVQLDTNSAESIDKAVSTVKSEAGRLDVLVNNAGIISGEKDRIANLRITLETNVIATFVVSEAFKKLLIAQAPGSRKEKRIVNVSSDLGSIAWRCDPNSKNYDVPSTQYRMSKAALNMMTACQSYELKEHDIKVLAFNPGYTITELFGPVELRREQGAWEADVPGKSCANIIAGDRDNEIRQMIEVDGVVPW
ncbi:hypothetical protein TruAng_007111 [Truncatella angustata]|nr:hypothetical protein TruAng_007111 [Truncatella angustata]